MIGDCENCGHSAMYHLPFAGCIKCSCDEFHVRSLAARVGLMLAILLVVTGCGCEQVDSGHVGVVRRMGAVSPHVLPEGFNWVNVLDSVEEISVQTGATTTKAQAASKDLQAVETEVAIQWSTPADHVVCLVQKFGTYSGSWTNGILEPAVQEVVKAVSARYTAEQLITQRAEVKLAIELGLNEFVGKTLKDRECDGGIRIANVAVTNFHFSPEFNASIEAKVKAEQDALRAENEKRTRVTQAEARAKEKTRGLCSRPRSRKPWRPPSSARARRSNRTRTSSSSASRRSGTASCPRTPAAPFRSCR